MSTVRLEAVRNDTTTDIPMQPASDDIWDKKYRLKTKQGEPVDADIDGTYQRVARALAEAEATPEKQKYWNERFLWALRRGAIAGVAGPGDDRQQGREFLLHVAGLAPAEARVPRGIERLAQHPGDVGDQGVADDVSAVEAADPGRDDLAVCHSDEVGGGVGIVLLQPRQLGEQLRLGFGNIGIGIDALDRAHHHALRLVEMADALGAARRIDDVDLFALRNRLVRTRRLADVAVDAERIDLQGHADIVVTGRGRGVP